MMSTIQSSSTHQNAIPTTSTVGIVPDKYRGAVVEDLQLPPAFALPSMERVSRVIELAYDRDFSHIPVLDRNRKPLGYVEVSKLKQLWESGKADPTDSVSKYMTRFKRSVDSHPYSLVTPLTELNELEDFLKDNIFALVTDSERKFVLAVATMHDLENFVTRRG
ncbi:hypothetical protein E1B28_008265 [Marasmius oreades]|uniref:CBS domain-containing protein n=1 Tax=Marasmius oreades TaxID=181124 RepID=A0A9P7UU40_9AGAR|nr:uncharacterized protein E1B28_008265 [Marasmius oreades]KAG7091864.1 hypothetical protein E1B28_008265 [Marasmius oreades]